MTDRVLLIRHCQSTGQEPGAPLSERGKIRALSLAEHLLEHAPGRLISSPFTRALDSIEPLARRLDLEVETDPRLAEWQIMPDEGLDSKDLADTLDGRRPAPGDRELRDEVLARVRAALSDAWEGPDGCTALVGHGKLFSVLLSDLTGRLVTEILPQLTNPDVFILQRHRDPVRIERMWDEDARVRPILRSLGSTKGVFSCPTSVTAWSVFANPLSKTVWMLSRMRDSCASN